MRMTIKKSVFILLLSTLSLHICLPASANSSSSFTPLQENFFDDSIEISMDFKDANIKDILKILSVQSGINFLASDAVQDRKVTLLLVKVPLKSAMDKIFQANNLYYEYDRNTNIFIVKDMGKPTAELETRIFPLKYASVSNSPLRKQSAAGSGITELVRNLLSKAEGANVIEDGRTNSLIVRDVASRMPTIAQAIANLDIPQPQVLIEVEVLDVNKGLLDKIGLTFGNSPFDMLIKGSTLKTTWPFPLLGDIGKKVTSADRALTLGSIDFNNANTSSGGYEVIFNFIRQQTDSKILARPRILTLNNETAEFKISTDEAIATSITSVASGTTTQTVTAVREETGIMLNVTPQVNPETGEITMFIMPTVKDTSVSSLSTSANPIRDPEERSTKSMVRVNDGETVVLGGLIRKSYAKSTSNLPFFSDLPLIGSLFRGKSVDPNKQRELLIFITPRIVKDEAFKFARIKKYSIPQREQENNSMDARNREVSVALDEYEKFDP
ncbi:MAG: hypothetical protein NC923_06330 [Candidatus Omnitrophica bacterium]|nr:hypothetical protein [Candidatus Omnitrophota bacterium]